MFLPNCECWPPSRPKAVNVRRPQRRHSKIPVLTFSDEVSEFFFLPLFSPLNSHGSLKPRLHVQLWTAEPEAPNKVPNLCLMHTLHFHFGPWTPILESETQAHFLEECAECWVSSHRRIPRLSGTFHPLVGQQASAASSLHWNVLASSGHPSLVELLAGQQWTAVVTAAGRAGFYQHYNKRWLGEEGTFYNIIVVVIFLWNLKSRSCLGPKLQTSWCSRIWPSLVFMMFWISVEGSLDLNKNKNQSIFELQHIFSKCLQANWTLADPDGQPLLVTHHSRMMTWRVTVFFHLPAVTSGN